ncbi:hypothetical protein FIBSPDRAFT_721958 [Athelia psychrophila]|uniref:Uncharacterized protein n=1 Tax=Athelia psychrophila TaxID=1759441 RepID=A0A166VIZ6_9AGAM|nr:hypothetical protein FIBSPDRAFT_721958 [Fibularhizoctonia sp. CBS 109695]
MWVSVLPYDPAWATAFSQMRTSLSAALEGVPVISIEHVGSTSVPGLAAKPIIDIDIIVAPEDIPSAMELLTAHGYTYAPEPRGIDRYSFRYNAHAHDSGATRPTEDGAVRRAVYLNVPTGVALQNHLAVRDVLLRDPGLVEEYARVKTELATREHENIGYYGLGKNGILRKILAKGNLAPEVVEAIAKVNVMPPLKMGDVAFGR